MIAKGIPKKPLDLPFDVDRTWLLHFIKNLASFSALPIKTSVSRLEIGMFYIESPLQQTAMLRLYYIILFPRNFRMGVCFKCQRNKWYFVRYLVVNVSVSDANTLSLVQQNVTNAGVEALKAECTALYRIRRYVKYQQW